MSEVNTPTPDDVLDSFFNDGESDPAPATPTGDSQPPAGHVPVEDPTPTPTPDPAPPGLPDNSKSDDGKPSDDDDFGSPFGDDPSSAKSDDKPDDADGDAGGFEQETWKKLEEMGLDPHTGIKFKEAREELRQAREEVAKLKANSVDSAEMQELRAKVADYENLQTDYKELKQNAALNDYRQTDEYDNQVTQPYTELQKMANLLEKSSGIDEGTILKAISNSDPNIQNQAISELEDRLDTRTLSRVNGMADQMIMLYGREDQIASQAEARLSEYNERQTSEQAVASEEQRRVFGSHVDGTFSQFENKIPMLISEDGGRSEAYGDMLNKAKSLDFSSMDGENQAFAAMASVLLPSVVKQYKQAQGEIRDLKALNNEYKGATPSSSGGSPSAGGGGGEGASPEQVLSAFFNS